MIILLYNDHQVLPKLVKTSSMCSDYFIKVAILRCIRNWALCVWHSYCCELHVSSLSFLIALLLCIQQMNKTGANSAFFFFPWQSQNDLQEKESVNKVKLRSWTEVSETNTMETSAREGEGLSRSRPLQKWNDFFSPPHKKGKRFILPLEYRRNKMNQ